MAITRLHTLYGVNLDTVATQLFINQISAFNIDTAIEEIIEAGDGSVDPTFAAVSKQNAKIGWTTSKIASVLAAVGIGGLKIDTQTTPLREGVEFWLQKIAEGGTRASGATHLKLTAKKGMVFTRQISADIEKLATMTMEAIATWDGINNPFIIADNQALEGTLGSNEGFVVGKVTINGVTLEGVQDITIDLGVQEIVASGDGEVWPTFAAIQSRRPTITVKTTDAISLNTFGLSGTKRTASTILYLRKVDEGGSRVADATAQHISFAVNEGRISVNSIDANDGDLANAEIKITPTYDGTNDILVINTATAII